MAYNSVAHLNSYVRFFKEKAHKYINSERGISNFEFPNKHLKFSPFRGVGEGSTFYVLTHIFKSSSFK